MDHGYDVQFLLLSTLLSNGAQPLWPTGWMNITRSIHEPDPVCGVGTTKAQHSWVETVHLRPNPAKWEHGPIPPCWASPTRANPAGWDLKAGSRKVLNCHWSPNTRFPDLWVAPRFIWISGPGVKHPSSRDFYKFFIFSIKNWFFTYIHEAFLQFKGN